MAGPTIDVQYKTSTAGLEKGMSQAANVTKSKLGGLGTVVAGVFGGNVLTAAASKTKDFFTQSVSMAMSAEQANSRFAQTLRNVTGATDAQISSANSFLGSMSKQAAVSKGELRPAFETLLRGTGDITKAQGALKTALDVSAGSGKPLEAVSLAMTKAFQGNVGGLQRLGIQTKAIVPNTAALVSAQEKQKAALLAVNTAVQKYGANSPQAAAAQAKLATASQKVTTAQKETKKQTLGVDAVMKNLANTFGGQASKQADTTAGKIKGMQIQFKAMQTSVGQALLPILAQFASILQATVLPALTMLSGLAKNQPVLFWGMVAAITALVVAYKIWSAAQQGNIIAQKLVTAAQWLWNAAVSANPIMLIVLAIIAFVAIIILAYAKVGWFRDAVDAMGRGVVAAFQFILNMIKAVWQWISKNWPLLLAILAGPIGIAVLAIMKYWDNIKAAALAVTSWVAARWQNLVSIFNTVKGGIASAIGAIEGVFNSLKNAASNVYNWVKEKFDAIVGAIRGVIGGITGAVGTIVNAIKGPINAAIDGLNAFKFTIPRIEVGVGPVKVGGGPWTVDLIPGNIPHLARGGVTMSEGLAWLHPAEVITPLSSAQAVNNRPVNIYVTVPPTANPVQVGRSVVDAIRSYETVAGTSWRRTPTGRTT